MFYLFVRVGHDCVVSCNFKGAVVMKSNLHFGEIKDEIPLQNELGEFDIE